MRVRAREDCHRELPDGRTNPSITSGQEYVVAGYDWTAYRLVSDRGEPCERAEQDEIVRRVESLFKVADTIETKVGATTTRGDRIVQAILAKAFRGELVPTEAELAREEGREYEPASVLLERISRERDTTASETSKKRRRRDAA
jgi:hypothetical protein